MALKRGQTGSKSINTLLGELPTYTVATLPAAAANAGKLVYVSNGAAGAPTPAFSNGTAWLRLTLGVAVAAA